MEYMAQQMDSLIEGSQVNYLEFAEETTERIQKFIDDHRYSWTVEDIVNEYRNKFVIGDYISYSAKNIITNFIKEFEYLTGLKKQ